MFEKAHHQNVPIQLQTNVISKRIKLGGWDWSRMKDLLKIFQMVTDFLYFLLFKHRYEKRRKRSIIFEICMMKKYFLLSFIKGLNQVKT